MFSESDGYELFMGRWSRRLAPLFVDFAGVGTGDHVLDVGCGTGALTFAAATVPSVRVVGVDPSSQFVSAAQRAGDGDRVRFQVGDASALPFPSAGFDRTLSLLVLNFVPDTAAAVREMIRVSSIQWRCGRGGLGLWRRHGDAPRVLGRGRRTGSGRSRARRTPHAAESAGASCQRSGVTLGYATSRTRR